MVINVAKSNVMKISRQPSPVLNIIRQKQLKYVGSLITDDARLHVKLNPGKGSTQQEEDCFHLQIGLKFKEETSELLRLEHSIVWC